MRPGWWYRVDVVGWWGSQYNAGWTTLARPFETSSEAHSAFDAYVRLVRDGLLVRPSDPTRELYTQLRLITCDGPNDRLPYEPAAVGAVPKTTTEPSPDPSGDPGGEPPPSK